MVPKLYSKRGDTETSFGTMTNRMVPKLIAWSSTFRNTFGTMTNRMVPKPRILLFNMIGVD